MAKKAKTRRVYDEDFKREAVQMLLDGHSAKSVAERLGITCPAILRRWKQQQLSDAGPVADAMDARIQELENQLRRVERERDVLKKALIIFGRSE
jgi:transposase